MASSSATQQGRTWGKQLVLLLAGLVTVGALYLATGVLLVLDHGWLVLGWGLVLVSAGVVAAKRDVPRVLTGITLAFGVVAAALGAWMLAG